MNNKGMVLLETVVICSIVILILTVCYYPFYSVVREDDSNSEYDSIENIYKLNNVRDFIYKYVGFNNILDSKDELGKELVSINGLNITNDTEDISNKYKNLLNILDIKYIYVCDYEINDIDSLQINNNFIEYLDYVNGELADDVDPNNVSIYRLVAQFGDETYASIRMWKET